MACVRNCRLISYAQAEVSPLAPLRGEFIRYHASGCNLRQFVLQLILLLYRIDFCLTFVSVVFNYAGPLFLK